MSERRSAIHVMSPLRLSLGARLTMAAAVIGAFWLAILWAS